MRRFRTTKPEDRSLLLSRLHPKKSRTMAARDLKLRHQTLLASFVSPQVPTIMPDIALVGADVLAIVVDVAPVMA